MKNSKRMANGVSSFRAKAAFLGIEGYETMNKRQIKARIADLVKNSEGKSVGTWGQAVQGRAEEWTEYWTYLKDVSRANSKLPPNPNSKTSKLKAERASKHAAAA